MSWSDGSWSQPWCQANSYQDQSHGQYWSSDWSNNQSPSAWGWQKNKRPVEEEWAHSTPKKQKPHQEDPKWDPLITHRPTKRQRYIWGRISHQHLLQMKNTRKKKSGSGGNRRCGQYLSDSYMGKIVCMDNCYMYIVVSWRAYVHTSTLHVWIFLSIFLVSNSGIPIPWKWLKTIHRNCKFRK